MSFLRDNITTNSIEIKEEWYNDKDKTFTEYLEEADNNPKYVDGGLDAFCRQLKRFDIKVHGSDADTVDKFYQCSQSSLLFPEFIRRCITDGYNNYKDLSKIIATTTKTNYYDYKYTVVNPNMTSVISSSKLLSSSYKSYKLICSDYESIRDIRLNVFAVILNSIGNMFAYEQFKKAIQTLVKVCSFSSKKPLYKVVRYICDLPRHSANIIITNNVNDILRNINFSDIESINIINSDLISAGDNTGFIILDSRYALEMIVHGDLIGIDASKIINKDFKHAYVSNTVGFNIIDPDAVDSFSVAKESFYL